MFAKAFHIALIHLPAFYHYSNMSEIATTVNFSFFLVKIVFNFNKITIKTSAVKVDQ